MLDDFSQMEKAFSPQPNGITGPEESPILGSGGFHSASHQATAGGGLHDGEEQPTRQRSDTFQGVTSKTTYHFGPLVAAGAVLGGFYYLVT